MLTDRVLPPDEWPRLAGLDLGVAVPHLDPATTQVIVVEDAAGAIVGCWALLTMLHAEGVWIAPAYRGRGSVARRLWRQMRTLVYRAGRRAVLTGAETPDVHRLLTAHGARALPQEYLLCL